MSKKWYTSDLHFHHTNIVKFTNRSKDTTQEEHDAWLIDLWNSQVNKGDLVYHLGDFSFSSNYERVLAVVKKLNGQKIFIRGNHCRAEVYERMQKESAIVSFQDYKEVKIESTKVVLFHYPITSWNLQGRGSIHLHGHCHGNLKNSQGRILDVGLDNAFNIYEKHCFFDDEMIADYMHSREIYCSDHHKVIKE